LISAPESRYRGAGPHLLRSFSIFSQFVEPPFYVCGTLASSTQFETPGAFRVLVRFLGAWWI
jgi:hypothetical protein